MAEPPRAGSGSEDPRPRLVDEALVGFTEARDVALVRLDPQRVGLRRTERLTFRWHRTDGDLEPYALLVRGEDRYAIVDLAPGRWALTPIPDDDPHPEGDPHR